MLDGGVPLTAGGVAGVRAPAFVERAERITANVDLIKCRRGESPGLC